MSDTRLGLGNGVRVISTKTVGRYAVITTDTNRKKIKRVVGRRDAIRTGQHLAAGEQTTNRR